MIVLGEQGEPREQTAQRVQAKKGQRQTQRSELKKKQTKPAEKPRAAEQQELYPHHWDVHLRRREHFLHHPRNFQLLLTSCLHKHHKRSNSMLVHMNWWEKENNKDKGEDQNSRINK
mmetsp:Transcript_38302/g.81163  ORF Transcript_38302/g.81163 Transcript_38302/m.81163 type:complete len:117 (-) Transcript_38302:38-388(-)